MPSFQLSGTKEQVEIIRSEKRFLCLIAGRRWGKTYTCANRIIRRCMEKNGFNYWYIAPTYAQVVEQFERIARLEALQGFIKATKLQPYPKITFINSSVVSFRTFERPKNLRGSGLDEIWVDEIQDINGDAFYPVIRPLLSDKRGTLIISGQHRGITSWYYDSFFLKGYKNDDPTYQSWSCPSSTGLVFQSDAGKEELSLVRKQIPSIVYDEEYDCVPVANKSAVFRFDDIKGCISGTGRNFPESNKNYIMSIDIGRIVDPTALIIMETDTGQVVYEEIRPLKERHELAAARCGELWSLWGCPATIVDTTGGGTGGQHKKDAFVKFYRKYLPNMREFIWTSLNKVNIIQELVLAIEQKRLHISSDCDNLIKQLTSYEFNYRNGYFDFHGLNGHNDDLVAAIAMAWFAKIKNWGNKAVGQPLASVM